jgi:hypothetical protein
MYGPPAAGVTLQRSARFGRLLACLSVASLATQILAYGYGLAAPVVSITLFVWLVASAGVYRYWRRAPSGRLFWDGELWNWSAIGEPLRAVKILYDFQQSVWVVLELRRGSKFGVWIDADPSQPEQWLAFRRALVGAPCARDEFADTP